MQIAWQSDNGAYTLPWAGQTWTLRPDAAVPGLVSTDPAIGPLLALDGLSESGRRAPSALSGQTLVDVDAHHGRIVARYAPLGWGALHVTAAWAPVADHGVELAVEIQARTVGKLHGLEVNILSTLAPPPPRGAQRLVEPRDARSAMLGYDGRERALEALTTGPPGEPLTPWITRDPHAPSSSYIELCHPDDVSRRIHEGKLPFATTRYALFGHDLEKGVVLRARIRGYWVPRDAALKSAERLWAQFLALPPALTR